MQPPRIFNRSNSTGQWPRFSSHTLTLRTLIWRMKTSRWPQSSWKTSLKRCMAPRWIIPRTVSKRMMARLSRKKIMRRLWTRMPKLCWEIGLSILWWAQQIKEIRRSQICIWRSLPSCLADTFSATGPICFRAWSTTWQTCKTSMFRKLFLSVSKRSAKNTATCLDLMIYSAKWYMWSKISLSIFWTL